LRPPDNLLNPALYLDAGAKILQTLTFFAVVAAPQKAWSTVFVKFAQAIEPSL
jgi:hypothetical protein